MKPIIGILMRPDRNEFLKDVSIIYDRVRECIISAGGIPLGIPAPVLDSETILLDDDLFSLKRQLSFCDGVVAQGGDDFYDYDIEAIKYCYNFDVPLLGICLSMQAIACALGGIIEDNHTGVNHSLEDEKYAHTVTLKPESRLYQIFKQETILVNSLHKCYITNEEQEKYSIVGLSDDLMVEAIEVPDHKFMIGVQWHPEKLEEHLILFKDLIKSTKL